MVAAGNDYTKDRKFRQLEAVKDNRQVKVIRDGQKKEVSTYDLVAGDICLLTTGDWIPADMMVLECHSLAVDEASMTGEPIAIKKNLDKKPFCFSGTKVMEGEAKLMVLAVGEASQWGILQMSLRGKTTGLVDEFGDPLTWPDNKRWYICPRYPEEESISTPLQTKLNTLAEQVGYMGIVVAILTFIAMMVKWGVSLQGKPKGSEIIGAILHAFLTGVTIVVVAVPEGLPLAVTIALAYSQRKMMDDNCLVRVLASCFDPATRVLRADGSECEIRELVVGDQLIGDDGSVRNIVDTCAGKAPMYEVSYAGAQSRSRNVSMTVTGNHQLVMYCKSAGQVAFVPAAGRSAHYAVDYMQLKQSKQVADERGNLVSVPLVARREFHYASSAAQAQANAAACAFAAETAGALEWEPTVDVYRQYVAAHPRSAKDCYMRRAKLGAPAAAKDTPIVAIKPLGAGEFVGVKTDGNARFLLADHLIVHNCETMGGATNITTDKTGTLTENVMTVVAGWVGRVQYDDADEYASNTQGEARRTINENIALNSTAFISMDAETGKKNFVGSKTECALLMLSEQMGASYEDVRGQLRENIVHMYPFSSAKKSSGLVLRKGDAPAGKSSKKSKKKSSKSSSKLDNENTEYVFYVKGASELVLGLCSHMVDGKGKVIKLDKKARKDAEAKIIDMASRGLRTLCLAYCDLKGARDWHSSRPESNLVCQTIVGIKDPVRKEVPDAVKSCQRAGVKVRMVTGDNILTASHIAKECGILNERGVAMTGPDFRKLSNAQLDPMLRGERQLDVIARCSPLDKQRLVGRLQALGEVVASTGDGTNDAPQLKLADVGFAMGIAGTEVAKEACDIILMDDNFSSVVKALMWGRNVYDSIRKFLQFQLTINVGALIVAFVGAVTTGESPLTAVQLLWVNLIMDTMAALALATELPTPLLLLRKPYGRFDALITVKMWRFILGHALWQVGWLLFLLYKQRAISFFAKVDPGRPVHQQNPRNYPWCDSTVETNEETGEHSRMTCNMLGNTPRQDTTVIFNTFVYMQVFNEFNARFLEDEKNLFAGLFRNHIFWIVIVITVVLQALITEFGGAFTQTAHLTGQMWLGCLIIAFSEIPFGIFLRFIPVPDTCCIPGLAGGVPAELQEHHGVAAKADPDMIGLQEIPEEQSNKLKEGSNWAKAQEVHTAVSVLEAFRRSGRK